VAGHLAHGDRVAGDQADQAAPALAGPGIDGQRADGHPHRTDVVPSGNACQGSRPVLGRTVRADRSVTLAEESHSAFLVKQQLDTPTSNRKSLHVRRSQSEQRLTPPATGPGTAYLRSRMIVLFWSPGAHRPLRLGWSGLLAGLTALLLSAVRIKHCIKH